MTGRVVEFEHSKVILLGLNQGCGRILGKKRKRERREGIKLEQLGTTKQTFSSEILY